MADHVILGIHIAERMEHALEVQAVLTDFGCNIKTRIGLHGVSEGHCAVGGIIILEFIGANEELANFQDRLSAISGVEVQSMVFNG